MYGKVLKTVLLLCIMPCCLLAQNYDSNVETKKKIIRKSGVILLSKSGGQAWKAKLTYALDKIRTNFTSAKIPIELVINPNVSALQKAADNLLALNNINTLVIIPVYLSSYDVKLEKIKYILTIRQDLPQVKKQSSNELDAAYYENELERKVSQAIMKQYLQSALSDATPQQIKTKLEIVMTNALDGALINETIEQKFEFNKQALKNSCFTVVSVGSTDKNFHKLRHLILENSLNKLKEKFELELVNVFLFIPRSRTKINDDTIKRFKEYYENIPRMCRQVAVGYSLYNRHLDTKMEKLFAGTFYNYDTTITPTQEQITGWIMQQIEKAKDMPPSKRFVTY